MAQALDPQAGASDNRILKKIIIGNPVAAGNIIVYNLNNAVFGATTNIAYKHTIPASFSTTNTNGVTPIVIDLTAGGQTAGHQDGLQLDGGGSITTDQTMQVTFLWSNPDDD